MRSGERAGSSKVSSNPLWLSPETALDLGLDQRLDHLARRRHRHRADLERELDAAAA